MQAGNHIGACNIPIEVEVGITNVSVSKSETIPVKTIDC